MDMQRRFVTLRNLIHALMFYDYRESLLIICCFRLSSALENADDFAIDYPKLWCYLAELVTPVVQQPHFTLSDLKPLAIQYLYGCKKAGVLFAEILNVIVKEVL